MIARRTRRLALSALFAAVVAAAPVPTADDLPVFSEGDRRVILSMGQLASLVPDSTNAVADDPRASELGQAIFFDPGFSASGAVSCSTCHDPAQGFTDGKPVAIGAGVGRRNAPTIISAAHQRWFFWDGRIDSLWAQALGPFESPLEMASNRNAVVARIMVEPEYRRRFEAIFGALPEVPDAAQVDRAFARVGKCIAAYERRLVDGPAPFDEFAAAIGRGDAAAMADYPASAQRGLMRFIGPRGCWRCHPGPLMTDGDFSRLGLPDPPGTPGDPGRLEGVRALKRDVFRSGGEHSDDPQGERSALAETLTEDPELFGQMRTPSLRQAARTAPYMHDGRFATLEAVIHFYSEMPGVTEEQHADPRLNPLHLKEGEIADMAAFLRTLCGPGPAPELCRAPDWAPVRETSSASK